MAVPVGDVLFRCPPWQHGPAADRWVHVGLAPTEWPPHGLYGELATLTRDWRDRGVIDDFFFMHKPPGLRLRFAPAPGRAPFVRVELRRRVWEWRAGGVVADVRPGAYEPEEDRFGGPVSMDHAHRMFTVDAGTWLEWHRVPRRTPAWALSLALLGPVFAGLGLDERAVRDVWARVAAAGRLVPRGVDRADAAADGLRRWWRDRDDLLASLPADVRDLATHHAERIAPLAAAWAAAVPGDVLRAAAAWYVVFHWNRAALTFGKQALITEALGTAERCCGDVR
jgi:thiopeptide-type bacteriocin biosynthesis protein